MQKTSLQLQETSLKLQDTSLKLQKTSLQLQEASLQLQETSLQLQETKTKESKQINGPYVKYEPLWLTLFIKYYKILWEIYCTIRHN